MTSTEITIFTRMLQEKLHKSPHGFRNVSRDDVQWLQTYSFILNKLELLYRGEDFDIKKGGDWRQAMDDVSKLKILVDELEDKKLVNEVAWYVDGIALFNITQPEIFKNVVYNRVKDLLEKLL